LTGWCPLCYEGVRHRRVHKGHAGYRPPKKGRDDVGLRIVRAARGDGGDREASTTALKASPYFKSLPALWEFLTVVQWEDGETRATGTVLFFSEEGRVKCCVNDRDGERSAFVTGGSWEGVIDAIEEGLVANCLDWRKWQKDRPGGRKGR